MKIEEMPKVEYSNQRVLTTKQIAELYGVATHRIKDNFANARQYFTEGVHYFKVTGSALMLLKQREGFSLAGKYASCLYLWTVQGAARHCKMINTPKAWEVFDKLERFYFECKGTVEEQEAADSQAEIAKLKEEMEGLKVLFEAWLEEMGKLPPVKERARELVALADKIKDDTLRDKILAKAANLLLGKNIF